MDSEELVRRVHHSAGTVVTMLERNGRKLRKLPDRRLSIQGLISQRAGFFGNCRS